MAATLLLNVPVFWTAGRFRGKYHTHLQGKKSVEQETSVQHVARRNSVKYRCDNPKFDFGSLLLLTELQEDMIMRSTGR
jgi:hypothetical protein